MPIRPENKARYPKDWKARSRFVRFYRARNRCEWCGAMNYEPHPITGSRVVLTVAHVFDDRPEASNLLNLAALCQRCHNRHDAKSRRRGIRDRKSRAGPIDLADALRELDAVGAPGVASTAVREAWREFEQTKGEKCQRKP